MQVGAVGIALAEVPDGRKVAAVAEVVVQMGHGVVAVAALRRAAGVVARLRGKVGNVARIPQRAEDVLRDLAGRDAVFGQLRERQRLVGRRGLGDGIGSSDDELLLLVEKEQEGVVAPDGPADRTAIVLVAQRLLRRSGGNKRRDYGQRLVAVVVVSIAVELIGAGLGGDVQVAAGAAARFAVARRLERVLVERVNGIDDAGDAADATLIDRVHVQVQIVVVCAVDGVVDLVAARAVDGARVVVAGKGRRGAEKLCEVAAVERHILQRLAVEGRWFA